MLSSMLRRRWPVLLIALAALVPIWRAIFLVRAIGPFDQIRHMAPWNGPAPTQPWDVLQADGVLQFHVWRDLVFDAWGKGQLPLWNPYQLAGTPLLANSQSAGFYPPHILMGVLHVPTAPAVALLAWLHLFWAGLGTYFLARKLGASRIGGCVAGTSFATSAFLLSWTALASVLTTVSWIPWVLALVVSVAYGSNPGRSGLWLAGASAMMVLAGHLQFIAYGFMGAGLLAVLLCGARARRAGRAAAKSLGWTALGLALGVAMALLQLLPVLSYSQFSHRRNSPPAEGYAAYSASALKPFELANLANAYSLGDPREPIDLDGKTISQYWPLLVKQGANFAESAVTVGPLVLGLLVLVGWKRPQAWALGVVGVLCLLLALGTVLNWPLYFLVPGWSSTGSPGRVIVLFVLAGSVLAGIAVSDDAAAPSTRLRGVAVCLPLALSLLIGPVFAALTPDAGNMQTVSDSVRGAVGMPWVTMAVLGVIGSFGVALVTFEELAKYRPAVAVLPIVLAWVGYGHDMVPTGRPLPTVKADATARIAPVNSEWQILLAGPALLPPDTASLSRIHSLDGYDSLLHRDSVALLHDIDGRDPAPPANGNMMFVKPGFDASKLAQAGVTQVWSLMPLPGMSEIPGSEDGVHRYSLPGPGRVTGGQIEEEGYDHETIRADGGPLTVRDRWMPGWTATIDGAPKDPKPSLWRELDVPPGQHVVRWAYSPPGLAIGLVIGSVAWLAWLAGLLVASVIDTRRRAQNVIN